MDYTHLIPMVKRLARSMSKDDEYQSLALYLLAVHAPRWKESYRVSLRTFIWRKLRLYLARAIRRDKRCAPDASLDFRRMRDRRALPPETELREALPDDLASIAVKFFCEGRPVSEIATEEGLSRAEVARRIRRAKERLHEGT